MIAWKLVGYDVKVNPVSERNEVLVGGRSVTQIISEEVLLTPCPS